MSDVTKEGLTRREVLRRGVVTGGAALAWATPVVTKIGLDRALASETSPVPCTPEISYIAIHFTCGTSGVLYSKFDGEWDGGAGQVESQCGGFSTANGTDASNFGFPDPNLSSGTLVVPSGCTVLDVAVFGGGQCSVKTGVNFGEGSHNVGCPSD